MEIDFKLAKASEKFRKAAIILSFLVETLVDFSIRVCAIMAAPLDYLGAFTSYIHLAKYSLLDQ